MSAAWRLHQQPRRVVHQRSQRGRASAHGVGLKWRRVAWLHLPSALWGAAIEVSGGVCPLTRLENWLRAQAGATPYVGGFVEQYVVPALYPEMLTRAVQVALGVFVILLNGLIYWRVNRPST